MGDISTMRPTLAFLFFVLMVPLDAFAAKRVALVVGNSAYRHAGELENPKNDAADMAQALKKLNFLVIEGIDLDKAAFDRKIRDFAGALQGAEAALFFYAGHGLQVAGQNYLVPIDAELSTAAALDFEMVRLDLVQRSMERETQTNILFLDACRNNPLSRNLARAMGTRSAEIGRGLAPAESGVGTLISFSTQPGNVALDGSGRNSPFAGALVRRIAASSDDLSALLIDVRNDVRRETQNKQIPWEHSALTGRFYFGDSTSPRPTHIPAPTPAPAPPAGGGVLGVFQRYNLLGTWVTNVEYCGKPPTKTAAHIVHRQIGVDGVERELLTGDVTRPRDRVESAEDRGNNVVSMALVNANRRLDLGVLVEGRRMRTQYSRPANGPVTIENGRYLSDKTETSWLFKCD